MAPDVESGKLYFHQPAGISRNEFQNADLISLVQTTVAVATKLTPQLQQYSGE